MYRIFVVSFVASFVDKVPDKARDKVWLQAFARHQKEDWLSWD